MLVSPLVIPVARFPINLELEKLNVVDPRLSSDIAQQVVKSLSCSKVIQRTAHSFGLNLKEDQITNVNVSCISGKGMNRVVLKIDANFQDGNLFSFVLKFPRAGNPQDINALNHAVMSIALGNVFQKDTGVLGATLEENPRFFITGRYYSGFCADQIISGNVIEKIAGNNIAEVVREYFETWYETSNPKDKLNIRGGKNVEPTLAQFIISDGEADLIDKGHFSKRENISYRFKYNHDRTNVDYEIYDHTTGEKILETETSKWLKCCGISEAFLTFYSYLKDDIRKSHVVAAMDDPDSQALAMYTPIQFEQLPYKPIKGIVEGLVSFLIKKFNDHEGRNLIEEITHDDNVIQCAKQDANLAKIISSLELELVH